VLSRHLFPDSGYSGKDCSNLSPQAGTFVLAIYHLRMGLLSGRVRLYSYVFVAHYTVRVKNFEMESFALDNYNEFRLAAIDLCRLFSTVKRTKNCSASVLSPFNRMWRLVRFTIEGEGLVF